MKETRRDTVSHREKQCIDCKKDLPIENFYLTPSRTRYSRCKKCHYKRNKKNVDRWRKNNPEKMRELNRKSVRKMYLKRKYGVFTGLLKLLRII